MSELKKHIAIFEGAYDSVKKMPENDKEICFLGRSNSGKSSLIAALFQNKSIVKTSSKPGCTQTVNLYKYNSFFLTDLPGYGYAKISKSKRSLLSNIILEYISKRKQISTVFLLLDCKREPEKEEIYIRDFFWERNIPVQLIFTKIDRLNQKELFLLNKKKKDLETLFHNIVLSSSKKNIGIDFILNFIQSI
ncbi:MAG: ribosome biogenesis GTP-binding protein YihA/YsxC [Spirochaetia bacterium]|nr:ribosome biogenesis GTP-binding protein YihA/YsxC [Spirochaetia bacterium]